MLTDFAVESLETSDHLDLFSTSPTKEDLCFSFQRCDYGAPMFAFSRGGARYGVVQGCCNHWECRRCGQMVAKKHYGRIVEGAREIAREHELWFITITCEGGDLSAEEATKHYLAWTSKFLDACYTKAKRKGDDWYYVQVTEKQRRGHPHSHILTTFHPHDIVEGAKDEWSTLTDGTHHHEWVSALRSDWLQEMVCRAGLGEQYDISAVESVEAASRYVAKYMFKDSQFSTHFPKGWKRVRYSQSWPDFEREKTDAFVLLSREDWQHLASVAAVVDAETGDCYESAQHFLTGHDTIVYERIENHERSTAHH